MKNPIFGAAVGATGPTAGAATGGAGATGTGCASLVPVIITRISPAAHAARQLIFMTLYLRGFEPGRSRARILFCVLTSDERLSPLQRLPRITRFRRIRLLCWLSEFWRFCG